MSYVSYVVPSKRKNSIDTLTVIILSSSVNFRSKCHGCKSLQVIDGDTVINHQVNTIRSFNKNSDIILVGGFEFNKIVKQIPSNIRLIYNQSFENTNNALDAKLGLLASTNSNVIFIDGELVFSESCLECLINPDNSCTIVDERIDEEIGVNINKENNIEIFSYENKYRWSKMVRLTGQELAIAKNHLYSKDSVDKMLLHEILNLVIDNNGIIKPVKPSIDFSIKKVKG